MGLGSYKTHLAFTKVNSNSHSSMVQVASSIAAVPSATLGYGTKTTSTEPAN